MLDSSDGDMEDTAATHLHAQADEAVHAAVRGFVTAEKAFVAAKSSAEDADDAADSFFAARLEAATAVAAADAVAAAAVQHLGWAAGDGPYNYAAARNAAASAVATAKAAANQAARVAVTAETAVVKVAAAVHAEEHYETVRKAAMATYDAGCAAALAAGDIVAFRISCAVASAAAH